jgi:hypothetical protein
MNNIQTIQAQALARDIFKGFLKVVFCGAVIIVPMIILVPMIMDTLMEVNMFLTF